MGLFSTLRKAGGLVAGAARTVSRIPGVSMIPGVGTVLGAAGLAGSAYSAYSAMTSRPSSGGMPGLPAIGGGNNVVPFDPNMGKRSIFRDDPNVPEQLKAYAIDNRFLKQFYRAPKGFVVLKDVNGDAFAIPKKLAQMYGMWKPAAKPPISVRDWHHLQGANRVVKKLKNIEKTAQRIANFRSPRRAPRVAELPGKQVIIRKAA